MTKFFSLQNYVRTFKILVALVPGAMIGAVFWGIISLIESDSNIPLAIALIVWIPVSLLFNGYFANLFWKWR